MRGSPAVLLRPFLNVTDRIVGDYLRRLLFDLLRKAFGLKMLNSEGTLAPPLHSPRLQRRQSIVFKAMHVSIPDFDIAMIWGTRRELPLSRRRGRKPPAPDIDDGCFDEIKRVHKSLTFFIAINRVIRFA